MSVLSKLKRLVPLLIALFIIVSPIGIVFAEEDQNKSVSDYFEPEKDGGQNVEKLNEEHEPAADRSKDGAAVGVSGWDYARTLLALLFVVGLLLALLKFINRKNRMFDQHRFMKNVGGLSLGQQKSIQLVLIGESYYLVGVGDEVRLLKEITDPKEIETLERYLDDEDGQSSAGLVNKLLTFLPQSKLDTQEKSNDSADFKNVFTTRLEELKAERKKHMNRLTEKESRKDE